MLRWFSARQNLRKLCINVRADGWLEVAGSLIFLLRASLQSLTIYTRENLEASEASMARLLAPIEDAVRLTSLYVTTSHAHLSLAAGPPGMLPSFHRLTAQQNLVWYPYSEEVPPGISRLTSLTKLGLEHLASFDGLQQLASLSRLQELSLEQWEPRTKTSQRAALTWPRTQP